MKLGCQHNYHKGQAAISHSKGLLRDCTTSPINRLQLYLLHTAGAGTHDRLETVAPCHTGSGDRHDAAGNWITDHRLRDRLGHASHGGGMSSSCYKHLIRGTT